MPAAFLDAVAESGGYAYVGVPTDPMEVFARNTRYGVPESVSVISVKKHQSKADAVLDPARLGEGQLALFVDDMIAEHLDPQFIGNKSVRRVLFSRMATNDDA